MTNIRKVHYKELILHLNSFIVVSIIISYRIFERPGLWFADEFGYAGTAAYLGGLDWSAQIQNIAYYGVGYSFLMAPAYRFCDNARQIILYGSCLNIILLMGVFELSVLFMKRIRENNVSIYVVYICSLFSTLYINNIVQLQLHWTEIFNLFLYWCILIALMKLFLNNKLRIYILLSFLLCYAVFVHMRNVGIVLSCSIILLIYLIKCKRVKIIHLVSFVFIALTGIVIFFYSKEIAQNIVWNNSDKALINDVGTSVLAVKSAFTLKAFPSLINSMMCKFFYAVASTYGLILFGIFYAVREIRNKDNPMTKRLIYSYIVLCFFFQFMIGSIAMNNPGRLDCVIYGRYYEHCIGALVCLGIYSFYKEDKYVMLKRFIKSVIILIVCAFVVHEEIREFGNTYSVYPCIAGLAKYFIENLVLSEVTLHIVLNVILCFSVVFVIFYLLKSFTQKGKLYDFMVLLPVAIICYVWISDGRQVADHMLSAEIKRYEEINPISNAILSNDIGFKTNTNIYYFVDSGEQWNEYLLGLQFNLGGNKLISVSFDEWNSVLIQSPQFIVKRNSYMDNNTKAMEIFAEKYIPIGATKEFILYCANEM